MVHFIPPSQRRLALLAAQADGAPVLIYGADGTGKGAIARWIHQSSARSAKPFLEADRNRPILDQLQAAQGGTFVIHEIGERNLSEQKQLLQFLKTRAITTSGVSTLLNVRIMVSTSQTLEGRAQAGLFNAELLTKLNVFRLEMPTLEKRTEEFKDIVLGILGEITRELHKEHLKQLSAPAWERLKSYEWPGNLRELRNVLRMAVIAAQGDQIELGDLPDFGHDRIDFRATREQFEKIYILELLKTFDWQIDKTCKMTRMDKNTLLNKIDRYGISLRERTI